MQHFAQGLICVKFAARLLSVLNINVKFNWLKIEILSVDVSNLIWKKEKSNPRKLRKKFRAPGENEIDGT